jgi:VWFA-related protein
MTSLLRCLLPVGVALAGLIALAGPRPVLEAQAPERQLYVSVLDEAGKPVPDLGPADIVVREDGVAREVLRVARATDPLLVALLVDTSAAATYPMPQIRDAVTKFVDRMAGANEIALITFGDRPSIVVDYTQSAQSLKRGVGRLYAVPGSGAYLLDAIVDVARGIGRREAARPVMIAISTEGTEYSNYRYQAVLERLAESGAAFHALVIEEGGREISIADGPYHRNVVFDRGTASSGGRRENLLTSMSLEPTMDKLAEELSNQYLVTYARPESLIPPERVSVAAAKAGFVARGTPVRTPRGATK